MTYEKCADAYKDGVADIREGTSGYAPKLDRDNDGIACEKADAPAGFVPRAEPKPAPQTAAAVPTQPDRLPQTGPGEVTAVGLVVVLAGAGLAAVMRRRRTRFTA